MIRSIFVTLLAVVALGSCSSVPKETDPSLVTLTIGSEQADCSGIPSKKCLIIKKANEHHWVYLYSPIEGLAYERGYEYTIQARQIKIAPTQVDVSTVGYVFVKELSKERKNSVGMPGFTKLR